MMGSHRKEGRGDAIRGDRIQKAPGQLTAAWTLFPIPWQAVSPSQGVFLLDGRLLPGRSEEPGSVRQGLWRVLLFA